MTPTQKIGHNIRRIRRAEDLTQEVVAERAGIHRTLITGYEWGEREPKALTLLKLAGAIGVEPADLLAGVRWESAPGRFVTGEDEA
jgi:transcriptional regulator with XRE-family HTH domain